MEEDFFFDFSWREEEDEPEGGCMPGEDMSCEWRAPRDSSNGMWRFTSVGKWNQSPVGNFWDARRLGRRGAEGESRRGGGKYSRGKPGPTSKEMVHLNPKP